MLTSNTKLGQDLQKTLREDEFNVLSKQHFSVKSQN